MVRTVPWTKLKASHTSIIQKNDSLQIQAIPNMYIVHIFTLHFQSHRKFAKPLHSAIQLYRYMPKVSYETTINQALQKIRFVLLAQKWDTIFRRKNRMI